MTPQIRASLRITDVRHIVDALDIALTAFGTQAWWRGMDSTSHKLQAAAFRRPHEIDGERRRVLAFRARAPGLHADCPAADDLYAWLALMQHYRLPTRLLDWSEAPLVAALFAATGAAHDDGVLWALQPAALNQNLLGHSFVLMPDSAVVAPLLSVPFGVTETDEVPDAVAIMPTHIDRRLAAQLAGFTLHGAALPLEELPNAESYLLKFEICGEAKAKIRDTLFWLGIRETHLFPDLEHLASELATTPGHRLAKVHHPVEAVPLSVGPAQP